MKTKIKKLSLLTFTVVLSLMANAQNQKTKRSITVLNVDTKGVQLDPAQMGNLVRIELEKLDTFQVMDRYDVTYVVEKNQLNINNCYGKLCLVEIGNVIKSEKMFSGSVELYGETIIITMRQVDVASASIEKTEVMEFLNLQNELQNMLGITIRKMYGRPNDEVMLTRLTKKFHYESLTNNPTEERLNLTGPRMGFTMFTGKTAKYLKEDKNTGGYEAMPLMFQFGYQFEKQYLNEGNFQALFEFIPLITGLDQGLFIPSLTLMNGLRNNKHGWEFAFGPTISIVKKTEGYFEDGTWKEKFTRPDSLGVPEGGYTERVDSRGTAAFSSAFVFAFGKTFKSGKLNIPVNLYVMPHKDGVRFGGSFGFNAKKRTNYK